MLEQAVPPTYLTIASDVALGAAQEFDRLLASFTQNGFVERPDLARWRALDRGGWLAAGQSLGGERFHTIDLVELAIAWGRHIIPEPFITTLVALRHIGADAPASDHGITFSLVPGPGALVPFGELAGCAYLSRLSGGRSETGAIAAGEDDFAPSLPLATAARGTALDDEIARETVVLRAAEMIGMAETLLRKTVDFTNVRKLYGQELAKFQAIRFRMADVHTDVELMRGLVAAAVNEPELVGPAARQCARTARRIAEQCLQTHGAMGFTWELGIHRYMRHAMATEKLLSQYR